MNNYAVTIKNFKTKKQAVAFANWLSNQGEQDFAYWAEVNEVDGISVDDIRCKNKEAKEIIVNLKVT